MVEPYDIADRQKEYEDIMKIIHWLELGVRSVSIMYDDHSSDKNSKENIFRLKDSIHYRLISAGHMYKLLLEALYKGEQLCEQKEMEKNRNINFLGPNPYFEILEMDISAVFDAVIFNIVSVFDYLSHIICYICKTQKQDTLYWTRLAKAVRNANTELGKSYVGKPVDQADRKFVAKLYDYRSTLIHNKREKHGYSISHNTQTGKFNVKILITTVEMKDFKLIYDDHDKDVQFTLPYLASWLIKTSGKFIEEILESLCSDVKSNSSYEANIRGANGKGKFVIMDLDPKTNIGRPISDSLWDQFKSQSPYNKAL